MSEATPPPPRRTRAFRLLLALAALGAAPVRAQDAFEIQVYDAETAGVLEPGLEIHLNHFFQGTTRPGPGGEVPSAHLSHFTLEPHLGLTAWWELGLYLQSALRPDGGFDSGGVKFRTKFRWPGALGHFRLAVNVEVSRASKRYEADGWGSEIRPIVDARWGPWYVSLNPIVSTALAGDDAWTPEFEPAAKVALDVAPRWAVGLEGYSGFGPFRRFLPLAEQTHRLFGVVDFTGGIVGVQAGVGYGLSGPEKWIVKAIVSITPPSDAPAIAGER